MISFEFTPTKDDYIQTYQAFYLTKWQQLVAMLLTGTLLGVAALILIFAGDSKSIYLAIFPAAFSAAIFFTVIYTFLITPNIAASQVEKNERFISPTRYDFGDENVTVKNQFTESKFDWGTFNKVIETKKYFLLIHSATNKTFHFVPKRAFTNTDAEQNFRLLLLSKIQLKQKKNFNLLNSPIAIIVIILMLACCIFSCGLNIFSFLMNSS